MSNVSQQKVEVSVSPCDANTQVVVRTGDAAPIREPKPICIIGDINTVATFLQKRQIVISEYDEKIHNHTQLQSVYKNRSIVEVDKEAMTITLLLDPESYFGGTVKGSLSFTEEFKQFKINSTTTYSREEIVKLLRFNKRFFENLDKYNDLLKAFQSFTGKANIDTKNSSDLRANREHAIKVVTESNIPNEFILLIPVFKGVDALKFRVEVCFDFTDGGFAFWFESPELKDLIEVKKEEIFKEQLQHCNGLVIVNK